MKKKFLFPLLLFVFLIGFSCENDKIQPGFSEDGAAGKQFNPENIATVEKQDVTRIYEAVGTIRPLTESMIESQVSAQVIKVLHVPGTAVKKGELLIQLDARRLTAQLKQAQEGLNVAKNQLKQAQKSMDEAKAGLDQTMAAYNRTQKLFKSAIVTSQKLEIDKSAFLQAKARLEKSQEAEKSAKASIRNAEEIVKEGRIALGYSQIIAPAAGVVAKRMIDPGDIAVPGKPLLIIQTSGALRLEANVREGLISRVIIGNEYRILIKTIGKTVQSRVEEIVPYADPATRTFLVKATLPETPGIYPGMFGRLLIPVEKKQTLLIPQKAVIQVGQLELVYVKNNDTWQSVYIKTGKKLGDKIEVLAGLTGNETIGYK
ncbi:efflux RND transporter periplasmic adaptor subunit [Desulfobacula toluolica]|uniref:MdtA2: predicted multidrug resistance protein A n=1 Tax=Desulfobacula toluolica (strain DSM 7467 / Tol2) TaxID=651182 RepID=K0NKZ2_DESTT|nr:efflux RND transporter periplasmic adaptor subunit [Desulfobacula toluolica]CCK82251.1 MdtA2: predicted multidrug resistance protein A [Desulfobacula toluolica Tol2]